MILNADNLKANLSSSNYFCWDSVWLYKLWWIWFATAEAVWKWSCKPICMFLFSNRFLKNMFHLSDAIDIWSCYNESQVLNKKVIVKCREIKVFEWIFLYFKEYIIVTLRICTVKKYELILLLIIYFHGKLKRSFFFCHNVFSFGC